MTHNDDRVSPPRRPPDPGVDFDSFRNTTLPLSIGVARFGRTDVNTVLLTLCLGSMLVTARDGEQDDADVLMLNGHGVEYSVVHRVDPIRMGKQASTGRRAGSSLCASSVNTERHCDPRTLEPYQATPLRLPTP